MITNNVEANLNDVVIAIERQRNDALNALVVRDVRIAALLREVESLKSASLDSASPLIETETLPS